MDSITTNKFNKLIKLYNDESSKTKRKNISKNITKQVLNLKKNNKDRTKILNSYKKWLKNNNNEIKSIQTGGGDETYQILLKQLGELEKDATVFATKVERLNFVFKNPDQSQTPSITKVLEDLKRLKKKMIFKIKVLNCFYNIIIKWETQE